jgi:hypothetical protein
MINNSVYFSRENLKTRRQFRKQLAWMTLLSIGVCSGFFAESAEANPITWQLINVTFDVGSGQVGQPGPIVATGSFVYDADLHQYLTWNITVSGAADPTINFTYTPGSSFIPSIYQDPSVTSIEFVRTLPGNPPENPFGTSPFDSNSVLIALDFFASPGNAGLTDAGGTIDIETGGTQLYQIASSTHYGVRSGAVSATPEPSGLLLGGSGVLLLCAPAIRRRLQRRSQALVENSTPRATLRS